MRILAMVGLALIMGCGAARQMNERSVPYQQQITTIVIANEGQDVVRVYDVLGRIATVMPSRAKCVQLKSPERATQLSFSILGGGSFRYYTPTQNFGIGNGWIWRIDSGLPDISSIRINAHQICNPGGEGSLKEIR